MRIACAVVLLLHGLVHLLGFVKAFGLAEVAELSQAISRPVGGLWLAASLSLVGVAALLLVGAERWWIAGLVGLVLSQSLIVGSFGDAKWGTLPNLGLLVAIVGSVALARHGGRTRDAVGGLLAGADAVAPAEPAVTELPEPVQRWLERSGALDRPRPRTVRLTQAGSIQLAPGQGFRPVTAEQWFTVDPPGYLWSAKLEFFGIPVVGCDTFAAGAARMRFELAGLLPIVDASDEKIAQGALLRWFGETVWFPRGALSPGITWAPGPEPARQAIATIIDRGIEARAVVEFDDAGRFVALRADRYRGGGPEATLTPWSVHASAWDRFDGVEVPTAGEVVWHLDDGDFVFYRWTLTALEYDPAG